MVETSEVSNSMPPPFSLGYTKAPFHFFKNMIFFKKIKKLISVYKENHVKYVPCQQDL